MEASAPVTSLRVAMAPPVVYTKGCCSCALVVAAKANKAVKRKRKWVPALHRGATRRDGHPPPGGDMDWKAIGAFLTALARQFLDWAADTIGAFYIYANDNITNKYKYL